MLKLRFFCALALLRMLTACSSLSDEIYSTDTTDAYPSQAAPEAYAGHHFTFIKEQVDHSAWQPTEFYFKKCSIAEDHSYYSKTAYECNQP